MAKTADGHKALAYLTDHVAQLWKNLDAPVPGNGEGVPLKVFHVAFLEKIGNSAPVSSERQLPSYAMCGQGNVPCVLHGAL